MKIISASRRTDIPAFYSQWFLNRIEAEFCHRLNPVSKQVYRVSLRPEDCLAIVFWTRYPRQLMPYLDLLKNRGYCFYFHFTITGYQKAIENHNPPLKLAIQAFQELSQQLSSHQVQWRYDPIILSNITPESYHVKQFDYLSQQLEGYTQRCYFSFVDFYQKTERNLGKVARQNQIQFQHPTLEQQKQLVEKIRDIATSRGITLYSCCNDQLVGEGVEKAHCIDFDLLQKLQPDIHHRLKAAPTRQDCGCVESADIGVYETCTFGCQYCYATNKHETAVKRLQEHDPSDTVLWRPPELCGIDLTTREYRKKPKKAEIINPSLF
ncbi:hypothetical protein M595_0328 [Lyngbya aestuarii BL J]|uniref:DUF1848 domain-containing protein n=1 Tax=Lyngbya aestuarii BL J TaxID=1348334 RepID=U7QTF0_9CYAN|nr:DUF1848 domain-containing protein [Lyngbya aestuarii]ERT09701.1 hypothetical protein M595_0328 [Lyngbya aestuarii BL J]